VYSACLGTTFGTHEWLTVELEDRDRRQRFL
jgi:hypothetical protein